MAKDGESAAEVRTGSETPSVDALRSTAVRSLGWSWLGTAIAIVLQVIYAAIIARLVDPVDFGILAGALLSMKFLTYLARMGITSAVLQFEHLDQEHVDAAHVVSTLGGVIGGALMFSSASAMAWLLGIPDSVAAIRWLSLGLLMNGLSSVPEAILRRNMAFKRLTIIQTVSYLGSNLFLAVLLAAKGFGLAALLVSYLAGWLINLVLLNVSVERRPRLRPSLVGLSHFVRFGGLVSLSSLLDVVGSTLDTVLVGRLGAQVLGQYNRASLLVGLPVEQASAAANRVATAGLARLQADERRFGVGLEMAIGLTALFVAVPVAVGAALATQLTQLVLGPNWALAGALLPTVAVAHGVSLVTQVVVSGAEAHGAVRARFWVQLASTVLAVALIGGVFAVDPVAPSLAKAWMLAEMLRFCLHFWLASQHLHIRMPVVRRRLVNVVVAATLVASPAWLAGRIIESDVVAVLVGGTLSALSLLALLRTSLLGSVREDLDRLGLAAALSRSRRRFWRA